MNRKLTSFAVAAILMLALTSTTVFARLPGPGMKIDVANTAVVPDGDGYTAALTIFRFTANAARTTEQVATKLVGAETAGTVFDQVFSRRLRGKG